MLKLLENDNLIVNKIILNLLFTIIYKSSLHKS